MLQDARLAVFTVSELLRENQQKGKTTTTTTPPLYRLGLRQVLRKWNTISKLLNDLNVLKFVLKGWIKVNNLSGGHFSVNKNITFQTSMLRSDLCNSSDAYIVIKGRITVKRDNDATTRNKKLIFENIKNQKHINRQCRRS